MNEQSAQVRWEHHTQRPLLAPAVLFDVAYGVPIVDSGASRALATACTVVEWAVWATFASDHLVRLALSGQRRAFVRSTGWTCARWWRRCSSRSGCCGWWPR